MESEPSNNAADESCLSASKLVTKERPEKGVYSVKINTKNKWTEATAKVLSLFAQHPELSSVQNHRQYSNKVVASNLGRKVSSSQGDKISNDIPISAPEAKIDNGNLISIYVSIFCRSKIIRRYGLFEASILPRQSTAKYISISWGPNVTQYQLWEPVNAFLSIQQCGISTKSSSTW